MCERRQPEHKEKEIGGRESRSDEGGMEEKEKEKVNVERKEEDAVEGGRSGGTDEG